MGGPKTYYLTKTKKRAIVKELVNEYKHETFKTADVAGHLTDRHRGWFHDGTSENTMKWSTRMILEQGFEDKQFKRVRRGLYTPVDFPYKAPKEHNLEELRGLVDEKPQPKIKETVAEKISVTTPVSNVPVEKIEKEEQDKKPCLPPTKEQPKKEPIKEPRINNDVFTEAFRLLNQCQDLIDEAMSLVECEAKRLMGRERDTDTYVQLIEESLAELKKNL